MTADSRNGPTRPRAPHNPIGPRPPAGDDNALKRRAVAEALEKIAADPAKYGRLRGRYRGLLSTPQCVAMPGSPDAAKPPDPPNRRGAPSPRPPGPTSPRGPETSPSVARCAHTAGQAPAERTQTAAGGGRRDPAGPLRRPCRPRALQASGGPPQRRHVSRSCSWPSSWIGRTAGAAATAASACAPAPATAQRALLAPRREVATAVVSSEPSVYGAWLPTDTGGTAKSPVQ